MCLYTNDKISKQFLEEHITPKSGWISGWKLVTFNDAGMKSIHYDHTWTPGINKADGVVKKTLSLTHIIVVENSIHVYLTPNPIRCYSPTKKFVLIKVRCNLKNLIGIGSNILSNFLDGHITETAFSEVYLTKAEYNAKLCER